tara:strand:- start:394 stop:561 length:168 start_codon:yes stop_codon:yes gene_type:complete
MDKHTPDILEALEHAEVILSVSKQTSSNKGGKGVSTTTGLALEKVRAAIKAAKGE